MGGRTRGCFEQIPERIHWAIKNGEIELPPDDQRLIDGQLKEMNVMMRVLICLYHRMLSRGRYRIARAINHLIRASADPYLPDIVGEIDGPDGCPDRFLDDPDGLLEEFGEDYQTDDAGEAGQGTNSAARG
jgi:hypothetical protein